MDVLTGGSIVVCLGITAQGEGRIYRFADKQSCQLHPLWQWGDAVFEDEYDLFDEYDFRLTQIPAMLRRYDQESVAASLESRVAELTAREPKDRLIRNALISDGTARDVLEALRRVAVDPPQEAEVVLELIRSERAAHLRKGVTTMAEAKTKEPKAQKEKKAKEPKVKTVGGHPLTAKLDFGATKNDKGEEVAYHPEKNNPKRGGAAERFKKYRKGITIADAIAAGMTSGNVAHDIERGYVVVRG